MNYQNVPTFKLMSTSGSEVSLTDFKGQKIVLYFYPKDNTPGCTLEGQEFNAKLAEFKKMGVVILGVSRDSVKSHHNFIDKCGFNFDLLSDADEKLCQYFDVIKEKNMYGKMVLGVERSTFVFDQNGKLIKEYRKVKAQGHAEEVLTDLKNLV